MLLRARLACRLKKAEEERLKDAEALGEKDKAKSEKKKSKEGAAGG